MPAGPPLDSYGKAGLYSRAVALVHVELSNPERVEPLAFYNGRSSVHTNYAPPLDLFHQPRPQHRQTDPARQALATVAERTVHPA